MRRWIFTPLRALFNLLAGIPALCLTVLALGVFHTYLSWMFTNPLERFVGPLVVLGVATELARRAVRRRRRAGSTPVATTGSEGNGPGTKLLARAVRSSPRVTVLLLFLALAGYAVPVSRGLAVYTLQPLGRPAVPLLVRLAGGTDPACAGAAWDVLTDLGPQARDAVPWLAAQVSETDDPQLSLAVGCIIAIGPDATPCLVNGLNDADTRRQAIILRYLSNDNVYRQRTRAVLYRGLGLDARQVRPMPNPGPAIVPALVEVHRRNSRGDYTLQVASGRLLQKWGAQAPEATIPYAMELLRARTPTRGETIASDDPIRVACRLLMDRPDEAGKHLPELMERFRAMNVPNEFSPLWARMGVRAVPALRSFLADPNSPEDILYASTDGLRKMGRVAHPAVGELRKVRDRRAKPSSLVAAAALIDLEPDDSFSADLLKSALGDEDSSISSTAESMIWELGRRGRIFAPHYRRWLGEPSQHLQRASLRLVPALGADAALLAGPIASLLESADSSELRRRGLESLAEMGHLAAPAVSAVVSCLNRTDSPGERSQAFRTLTAIGPGAASAADPIRRLVPALDTRSRLLAAEAVAELTGETDLLVEFFARHDASELHAAQLDDYSLAQSVRSAAKHAPGDTPLMRLAEQLHRQGRMSRGDYLATLRAIDPWVARVNDADFWVLAAGVAMLLCFIGKVGVLLGRRLLPRGEKGRPLHPLARSHPALSGQGVYPPHPTTGGKGP